ncbi:unnamed protein product [Protopolystoma xenopodis]|uniref:Uncharacterized protein n=1 Tax=Protopolystoma xenopodis TaxID=117903 RepID=A0A3S4ZID4_9PLAT|nr:unnamed protein product [Protopolystoma xenopodis]
MSRIGSTPSLQIHRLLPFIVRIDPPLPSPTLANSYPAARFSSQPVAYLASTAGQVDKARIPIGPESAELLPPLKRYRDSFSILRALAGCVRPVPGTIDFDAIDDPYLLPGFMHRICMRSKAAGNVAARALIREGLASNFARLCTEVCLHFLGFIFVFSIIFAQAKEAS